MIGRLSGTLLEKHPPQVLVDVGGVGYEVDVPMSTFYHLPHAGEKVVLRTHLIVREDAHLLYGFLTDTERQAFRQLLKINGVGAKLALSILSGLTVDELALAVTAQDAVRLTKIPGIGKKTAERLLLELKDKLSAGEVSAALLGGAGAKAAPVSGDTLNALLALGYSDKEARLAVARLPDDLPLEDSIRQALKLLAKG